MKHKILFALCLPLLLTACGRPAWDTAVAAQGTGVREIVAYAALDASQSLPVAAEKGALVTAVFAEVGERVAQGEALLTVTQNGERVTLSAPCPGIVAEIAAVGTTGDGKHPACVLLDVRRLQATPLLREEDVAALHPGDEAAVTLLSTGRSYPARLTKTYAIPETEGEGRYRVLVTLDGADDLLPGMTAKVTLYTRLEAVMVPHTAVGWDEEGYYAYAPTGEKLRLDGAVYCRDGYAVSGLAAGTPVAASVAQVEA